MYVLSWIKKFVCKWEQVWTKQKLVRLLFKHVFLLSEWTTFVYASFSHYFSCFFTTIDWRTSKWSTMSLQEAEAIMGDAAIPSESLMKSFPSAAIFAPKKQNKTHFQIKARREHSKALVGMDRGEPKPANIRSYDLTLYSQPCATLIPCF